MQTIEQKVIETYTNNLTYFSDNHPDLFNRLSLFNTALEQERYESNYVLEYKDGYFDVREKVSGGLFYNCNSVEHAKNVAKEINTQKNNHLFEGFRVYDTNRRVVDITNNDTLKEIVPIMHYINEHMNTTMHMKKIDKFIFIGVGLGLHLTYVDEFIHAEEYLIIEDDIELFRLSLFITNYGEIGKTSTLHLSIADNPDKFSLIMNNFLGGTFFHNRFLKYYHLPSHDDTKIKLIHNALTTQSFMIFSYDAMMDKFLRPLEYINRGFNVLNISKRWEDSFFSEKPVLLLAAGPSLQKNIEWVKQHHHKFIVVALSATLKILYNEGITPDVVTHIDGFDISMIHFANIPVESYLKETFFILGPYAPKSLREMIAKEQIFYFEDQTQYFENFGSLSTPCVGTTTLALMLMFGTRELYLLGLDLALDQESGKTHGDHHEYVQTIDIHKTALEETMSLETTTFLVEGNLRDSVYTTPLLKASIQSVYNFMPLFKDPLQNVYNLNDGAMLRDTLPTRIQEIDPHQMDSIDKISLSTALRHCLTQHSALTLSQADILSLRKRLDHVLWVKNRLDEQKKINYSSLDHYYYHLLGLISDLGKERTRESANLAFVLYSYFQYVIPLIFDMFNTRELTNPKKHIKKIDRILLTQLDHIAEDYEKGLHSFWEHS